MRKLFNVMFLLPLAIVLIFLSVANRQSTTFSLDPLNTEAPAISIELPLFVLLFGAVMMGMLIGGALTWLSQGKHRRALRDKNLESNQIRNKSDDAEKPAPSKEIREFAPGLPLISRS